MTVIGLDDTDSRTRGMCTTYAAVLLTERIRAAGGTVKRVLLVRLNPAVEHKTRGNAALAIHCDLAPEQAFEEATALVAEHAETEDERTNPGVVVVETTPTLTSTSTSSSSSSSPSPSTPSPMQVPEWMGTLARRAVREYIDREAVCDRLDRDGIRHRGWDTGQGLVGATAAVGAWRGFRAEGWPADWTYERIAYRKRDRWGTDRAVDEASVFDVADEYYPAIWDTVDRGEGEAVCVPNTPGPVLYGIRGDEREAVEAAAAAIESEAVECRQTFVTNQGTDMHLQNRDGDGDGDGDGNGNGNGNGNGSVESVTDGRAYRLTGAVVSGPETKEGGHVFVTLGWPAAEHDRTVSCVAFEPTKRFRDHVRKLRVGDRLTVCGEISDGTLKLEKLALRERQETTLVTPDCPDCGRSMKSAGANAGYRCRECQTSATSKVEQPIERALEHGWYEVPPCARRHIAKPLIRGGFDAPTHPER